MTSHKGPLAKPPFDGCARSARSVRMRRVGGTLVPYRRCEMVMLVLVVLAAWLGASLPVGVVMGRALRLAQEASVPAPLG